VILNIIDITAFIYYEVYFIRMVKRNSLKVPRNKVFSKMIYVKNLKKVNDFLKISGEIAAALRNQEINFDDV
jgi:hypothetical protein